MPSRTTHAPEAFLRRSRLIEYATADQNLRWVEHRLATEHDPRWACRRLGPASVVAGPRDAIFNTSIGLGLHGPVPPRVIDETIEVFRSVGAEPAFELSPFADPGLFRELARRGFTYDRGYQAYLLDLSARPAQASMPRDIEIEPLDGGDPRARQRVIETLLRGFDRRDPAGNGLDAARLAVEPPSSLAFLARVQGEPAGAGCCGVSDIDPGGGAETVAYLFSTSVRPEFRGRGVHKALMEARLSWARDRGAGFACVDSVPGLWTERTCRAFGFELVYTKPVLQVPAEGS